MKTKDLKEKLNLEYDRIVPDVLTHAKRAPINKLLSFDTPNQVLQKKLATRTLVFILVIFVVMLVALFGWYRSALPPEGDIASSSYVQIEIKDGDSTAKFGLAAGKGSVLCARNLDDGGSFEDIIGLNIAEIAGFFNVPDGAVVSIYTLNDNKDYARELAEIVAKDFATAHSLPSTSVKTFASLSSIKSQLIVYINENGGAVSINSTVETLATAFYALA